MSPLVSCPGSAERKVGSNRLSESDQVTYHHGKEKG